MKVTTEEKTITLRYVELDEHKFELSDLWNLMYELETTDMMDYVVIHNLKLKSALESREVINSMSRGGSYRGKNYESFFDELKKAV